MELICAKISAVVDWDDFSGEAWGRVLVDREVAVLVLMIKPHISNHSDWILTASLSIPGQQPWVVARWAFRGLLHRTASQLTLPEDNFALEQAATLDGLHFDLLEPAQASRLSQAVRSGAIVYLDELGQSPTTDPRDAELAAALTALIESLSTDGPGTRGAGPP